jgi:hypothetical protein
MSGFDKAGDPQHSSGAILATDGSRRTATRSRRRSGWVPLCCSCSISAGSKPRIDTSSPSAVKRSVNSYQQFIRLALEEGPADSSENSIANRIETGERSGRVWKICSAEVEER